MMFDLSGHSPIPNAIIAEMPNMSAPEMACTLLLAAATYGKQRRSARLTYKDFLERTMFASDKAIARALEAVAARGFFCRTSRSTWEIAHPDHNTSHAIRQATAEGALNAATFGNVPGGSSEGDAFSTVPEGSLGEVNTCPQAENTCFREVDTCFCEVNTCPQAENTCFREVNTSLRTVNPSAAADPANGGTEFEPPPRPDGTESVPLPYSKEIDPLPEDLERERKGSDEEAQTAQALGTADPLSKIPRPRTPEEKSLAEHPATKTWLASGLGWPGWVRLKAITRRMGHQPQPEKLQRAYEMWLMHGYRPGNIQGILDWYHSLCRDDQWQPYQQSRPPAGHPQSASSKRQEAFDLLQRMREERLNERNDDSGLPGFTSGRLSTDQPRPQEYSRL